MTIVQFNFPTTIKFGCGAVKSVPSALAAEGFKRPLIITDTQLATLPPVADLVESCTKCDLIPKVFNGVEGNPVVSQVDAGVSCYHEHGADSLIVIGGGASLDVGKIIALMVHHPGGVLEYVDGPNMRAVDQSIPFLIAIPTTAGTGSEVGRAAVISDDDTKAKKIIFHPRLLPPLVIADPELTVGLPPSVTAATGFDALTHNIEAFLTPAYHPMADGIALEAVHLVGTFLARAVKKATDLEARKGMLAASLMGAVAFQKGIGATHSCAHALSTIYDTHHGLANALMLEAVMRFNQQAVPSRLARLGQAVGAVDEDGTAFIQWIANLKRNVSIPSGLKAIGVENIEPLIEVAQNDPCHLENPRKVGRDDFVRLYQESL